MSKIILQKNKSSEYKEIWFTQNSNQMYMVTSLIDFIEFLILSTTELILYDL